MVGVVDCGPTITIRGGGAGGLVVGVVDCGPTITIRGGGAGGLVVGVVDCGPTCRPVESATHRKTGHLDFPQWSMTG